MKSEVPKVLHPIAGRALIDRVLKTARTLNPATMTIVVGHGADQVKRHLQSQTDVGFVVQEPQLGTGHALQQTESVLRGKGGTVILLSGDVPLLRDDTLRGLLNAHSDAGAAATVLTATAERPYGYGRIVRTNGKLSRIVEERDATKAQRDIREINSGIYALSLDRLFDTLAAISAKNAQGEYYLPDLIGIYRRQKRGVTTFTIAHAVEIRGINSRTELAEVSRMVRQQKNEELMAAGVTIVDPATTYIDSDVEIGPDTVVHPCVFLERGTRIGAACEIQAGARVVNSTLGDRVVVKNYSVITDATIAAGAAIGPFAHLRPGAAIGADARVGNFVELKKTTLGKGSKASHLAYLGDATIGDKVNVGAGTITCNFDGGPQKHQTVIEDGAFIGSNSTLVAPVTVGREAYVAAGSAVTSDVPAGALGIARGRQENKPGWAERRKEELKPAAQDGSADGA